MNEIIKQINDRLIVPMELLKILNLNKGDLVKFNIDDNNPTGTAKTVAAAVPYTLVKINGKMPKAGSCAVEAHFLPNRKLINPISLIAGIPDTIK